MAIRLSPKEIDTFKRNLELMEDFQDRSLLKKLSSAVYQSSSFHYEIVTGASTSVAINNIQMFSRHNVVHECEQLCSHLPLPKIINQSTPANILLDEIEDTLYPKRRPLRDAERAAIVETLAPNERNVEVLSALMKPVKVDTRSFPKIAQDLEIVNAADSALNYGDQKPFTVTIYGVAAGHVVEYLHAIYPYLEINVVMLNPVATSIMLALDPDMGKRFASHRVHLIEANDDMAIEPNAVILVPEILLDRNTNSRIKLLLNNVLEERYQALIERKRHRKLVNIMANYNLPYLRIANQLTTKSFLPKEHAVLIFPGNSVIDAYSRIVRAKAKGARIITCDSALPMLEKLNCAPDIVVCHSYGIYQVSGEDTALFESLAFNNKDLYKKSALITTYKTHSLIPALFSGNKYLIYTPELAKLNIEKDPDAVTSLELSSSASSLMVELAALLGAKRISIFGLDVVYRLSTLHGSVKNPSLYMLEPAEPQMDVVLCNDGRHRSALHDFVSYAFDLERLIAKHPEIDFTNCSDYGMKIRGARYVSALDAQKKESDKAKLGSATSARPSIAPPKTIAANINDDTGLSSLDNYDIDNIANDDIEDDDLSSLNLKLASKRQGSNLHSMDEDDFSTSDDTSPL